MTDTQLAQAIEANGFNLNDARVLNPRDLVELIIELRRGRERSVLPLERITALEAAHRLGEARDAGWQPARIIRCGPERPVVNLGFRRAAAYVR